MARTTSYNFALLNVAINPHPKGIYNKLFGLVMKKHFNIHGETFAALVGHRHYSQDIYEGTVLTWTRIDPNEPVINPDDLSEIDVEHLKKDPNLNPFSNGYNARYFSYWLRESDHLIFVNILNEDRKKNSASRVEKIFHHFLVTVAGSEVEGDINLQLVPDSNKVDEVFEIDRLNRLKIYLTAPNPEVNGHEDVMKRLERLGAKNEKREIVASSHGDGLSLSDTDKIDVRIASSNGYVEASGKDGDGSAVVVKTRDHPKLIKLIGDAGTAVISMGRRLVKDFNYETD